ncbi:flagellar protein FliT [Chitinimonas arctica]|uniref:flagellar protein FliT n=1 Tax=Chitinimonas arctica TaxID=2594795 RepID=UPI0015D104C7|nr:flagellar protein FliT [Chitinimonas arctica]
MSELAQWQELHVALHKITLALLQLARQEAWDELLEAVPQQQAALQRLESSPVPVGVETELAKQMVALIQETDGANQEVVARLAAWRGEVSTILEEIDQTRVNGKKLVRAYGA